MLLQDISLEPTIDEDSLLYPVDAAKNQEFYNTCRDREPGTRFKDTRTRRILCPICKDDGIKTSLSRSQDFPRHCEKRHLRNTWACPFCPNLFNSKGDLSNHIKWREYEKTASQQPLKPTPRQRVFACGVYGCRGLFRAYDNDNVSKIAIRYFKHIQRHWKRGRIEVGGWNHSTMMGNLLRPLLVSQQHLLASNIEYFDFDKIESEALKEKLECANYMKEDEPALVAEAASLAKKERGHDAIFNDYDGRTALVN